MGYHVQCLPVFCWRNAPADGKSWFCFQNMTAAKKHWGNISGARSVPALGTPPFTPQCGTLWRGLVTALAVYSSSLRSSVLSKMRAIQAHTSSPDNAICFDTHGMTGWYKAFPLLQSCQFSSATCDYFYGVYFNIHVMHPKCLEITCMSLCRRHFQAVAPKPPVPGHLWSWCAPTSARRFA